MSLGIGTVLPELVYADPYITGIGSIALTGAMASYYVERSNTSIEKGGT